MKSTLSEVRSAAARRGAIASTAAIAANQTVVTDGVVKTAPCGRCSDWYYIGLLSDTNLVHSWQEKSTPVGRHDDPAVLLVTYWYHHALRRVRRQRGGSGSGIPTMSVGG